MMLVNVLWKVKMIWKLNLLEDNKCKINIHTLNNNKIVIIYLMLNFKNLLIIKLENIILKHY